MDFEFTNIVLNQKVKEVIMRIFIIKIYKQCNRSNLYFDT